MQIEVMLPNKSGVLMPGAYVQVELPLQGTSALTVPTNALRIGAEGIRVAMLDADKRVRLRPVKIGRNYGQNVEVLDGLTPADEVVLNPSDSLTEGDQVAVAPAEKAKAKAPDRAAAK
jgi:multidrug efflux pump subunit AcrA (membrane-fusion protein)